MGQKILNVTQLFGTVCYLTDVVHVQNSTASFLRLALFLLPLKSGYYSTPFVGTPLWSDLWMGNTALGFRKAGFVAEILYRMCVCVYSLRSIRAGNLMVLKSGILLTEQKGKRHWLLEKLPLTGL